MKGARLILPALFAVLIVLLAIFLATSKFYITTLWFKELGYSNLLWTPIGLKLGMAAAAFIISSVFLSYFWGTMKVETDRVPIRLLKTLATLAVSFIMASWLADHWNEVLLFFKHDNFGVTDPIFRRDVGWYIFKLPVFNTFSSWLFTLTLFAIAGCVFLSQLDWRRQLPAGRLSTLGSFLLLLGVFRILLSTWGLVYSPRGVAFGASYTDVHAQIPANYAFIVVLVLLAIYLAINAFKHHIRAVFTSAILAVLFWIVIVGIYPAVFQKLIVAPNELAKETPYLRYNIQMTKKAYNLDNVEEKEFNVKPLTAATVEAESDVLRNIRLIDWRPVQAVYQQLQELRPYYNFTDLDVDRYNINGETRQVVLSVRELDINGLPDRAKTWVNERLKYTHGFGFVMSPISEITPEGQPEFIVKDLPPKGLKVKQPRIYVGESSSDYAFVNTTTPEFDYPRGDSNKYYKYDGKDGLKLGYGLRRLAFAWNYGFTKVLLSNYLTPDSRLLIHRKVMDRVNTLMPFVSWDQDPYPVFAYGRIYWIAEGFTTTSHFPFSEPLSSQIQGGANINYIRNSVKAVVDAYDGTVKFYANLQEPIIASYAKIFPVFKPFSKMPSELRQHLRYAERLFEIQSLLYRTYHMTDPQVFFNKEDQWNLPQELYEQSGGQPVPQSPYYIMAKLLDRTSPEFVLMRAFTPISKENMIAWLAGRCDGPELGNLILYKFQKQSLVYGPMQVEAKVNQDTELSKSLTLWNQQGSQVIRGNTLAYPLGESILYVQPIYLQAEQGKIPELKSIVTFADGKLGVGNTFPQALENLLGQPVYETPGTPIAPGTTQRPSTTPTVDAQIVQDAIDSLTKAQSFAGTGKWAEFGAELDRLSRLLNEMKK